MNLLDPKIDDKSPVGGDHNYNGCAVGMLLGNVCGLTVVRIRYDIPYSLGYGV